MTRSQVDAILDRLDVHSKKLDEVRSDVDKIKGGLIVIGAAIGAGLLGALMQLFGTSN
jgi:hypothetical protein